jgi:hypothetical protein
LLALPRCGMTVTHTRKPTDPSGRHAISIRLREDLGLTST